MAEWFQVLNIIRNKCVDPVSLVDRQTVYRDLLEQHPEHGDAIILTAQQRDGLIIEYAQNTDAAPAEPVVAPVDPVVAPVDPVVEPTA